MNAGFEQLRWAGVWGFILVCAVGCRQDMHDQPKMIAQRQSTFFSDGRSARQQVLGTVARSQQVESSYLTTGLLAGREGNAMPFPVTPTVMARGQEQFNIYCSPCHSHVGNGKGAIVLRGYHEAGNFQSTRLRQAPLGHFFWVMTHGYGAMPNYSVEILPQDRWAIAAYIRALQLSQNAQSTDLPPGQRVEHMGQLLAQEGLPANFLANWEVSLDSDLTIGPSVPVLALSAHAATVLGTPLRSTSAKSPAEPHRENISGAATQGERHESTPPPASKGDAERGKILYQANCSPCHQPTRAGLPPIFPSLIGIVEKDGEATVRQVVKEGISDAKPPMPAHPGFSETDFDDLIAFLKSK